MSYNNSSGFAGIIGAFNTIREANNTVPIEYPSSFEGIKEAILDIKKEWGNVGTGEYPDGWGLQISTTAATLLVVAGLFNHRTETSGLIPGKVV